MKWKMKKWKVIIIIVKAMWIWNNGVMKNDNNNNE